MNRFVRRLRPTANMGNTAAVACAAMAGYGWASVDGLWRWAFIAVMAACYMLRSWTWDVAVSS